MIFSVSGAECGRNIPILLEDFQVLKQPEMEKLFILFSITLFASFCYSAVSADSKVL
jgi:hypothetical protein